MPKVTAERSRGLLVMVNPHLPPHLREVCAILATGLVRLRRRTAEDFARDTEQAHGGRESSLRFSGHQSGHANARMKATA